MPTEQRGVGSVLFALAAAEALAHALDDRAGGHLVRAGQQEDELVAAVARRGVVRPQRSAQRGGDLPQQRVAGEVALLVVDALEVVEVDEHARERVPLADGAGDLLAHAELERAVVQQAGERVGARRGARVLVGLGVAAGDDGQLGDRLERAELLVADVSHVAEADAQGAAQAAVPAHRHADLGVEVEVRGVAAVAELLLQRVDHDGAAGGEHLAGDALAARKPVTVPVVGRFVTGGGDAAAGDLVDQVDLRHGAADRQIGLAGERVEDVRALERGVQGARGAGERVVALGLRDAPVLRLLQGEAERDLVGEELGELDVGLAPGARLVEDGEQQDVADVACPRRRARTARRRGRGRPRCPRAPGRSGARPRRRASARSRRRARARTGGRRAAARGCRA